MRTLTSILGNSQRLDGGAMFGNAPRALWTRWCEADELNRIRLACRCLLVRDAGRIILFETGIGAFFSPKKRERFGVVEPEHVLLDSLKALGIAPEDIDVIVLSHLHFDHAGGLLRPYQEGTPLSLAFSSATFVVGQKAWERAQNPHFRDRASFIPELSVLLEESGRLELVSGEVSKTLGDGYRFVTSSGHTPGMLLCEIDMPKGPVVFLADLIPGTPWVHLPITMGYDRFPELLIDEKKEYLAGWVERGARLFYTHDEKVAMSGVRQDERGRYQASDTFASIDNLDQ